MVDVCRAHEARDSSSLALPASAHLSTCCNGDLLFWIPPVTTCPLHHDRTPLSFPRTHGSPLASCIFGLLSTSSSFPPSAPAFNQCLEEMLPQWVSPVPSASSWWLCSSSPKDPLGVCLQWGHPVLPSPAGSGLWPLPLRVRLQLLHLNMDSSFLRRPALSPCPALSHAGGQVCV